MVNSKIVIFCSNYTSYLGQRFLIKYGFSKFDDLSNAPLVFTELVLIELVFII